jgi:hypothetical protein
MSLYLLQLHYALRVKRALASLITGTFTATLPREVRARHCRSDAAAGGLTRG